MGSSAYAYDANDNRVQVTESADGSTPVDRFYCYDGRDQLARNTGAGCDAGDDETYSYDAAGNRLSATDGLGTRTFSYLADGRYTGASHDAVESISTTTELRYIDGRITAEYVDGASTPSRTYVTDESGAIVKMVIHSPSGDETYLVTWNGHGDALNLLHLDE